MISREAILRKIISLKKSKEVTKTDSLAALFLFILSNESIFKPYLIELNKKLAQLLSAEKIPSSPSNYLMIHSIKLPFPPEFQCEASQAQLMALDRVLLEQEHKQGVNKGRTEQTIPEFVGQVPAAVADKLLNEGGLWNDNNFDLTSFIHGRFSHRLQHYILTRYIEDHVSQLSEVLPANRNALLKYLVHPLAGEKFYTAVNYSRGYWNLVLDNDKDNPNANFIMQEPNLTGPASLCEHLLTADSFKQLPYLTNCLYASMCVPLFMLSKKMGTSSLSVFKFYADSINNRKIINGSFGANLEECMQAFVNDPSFTPFLRMGGYEGVKHLSAPIVLNETKLKSGFFCQDQSAALKNKFFEKYKINPTGNSQPDLEKLLRTITANANFEDLQVFLEKFTVQIDAKDNNPTSGKTALHLAIIKAHEKPDKFDSYRECVKILLSKNASLKIQDADQKTPDYYDKDNRFDLNLLVEKNELLHRK